VVVRHPRTAAVVGEEHPATEIGPPITLPALARAIDAATLCPVPGTEVAQGKGAPATGIVDAHGPAFHALIAEDVEVNQNIVRVMLDMLGGTATLCSDGRQAVAAFGAEDFDVVFMDCQMPELDGFEATAAMREREQGASKRPVPIIALTAGGAASERKKALRTGMTDYITKPFTIEQIRAVLEKHVALRRPLNPPDTAQEPPSAGDGNGGDGNGGGEDTRVAWETLGGIIAVEVETGGDLLPSLLAGYADQARDKAQALAAAAARGDREALRSVAHALKSMSASLGAEAIRRRFEDVERRHGSIDLDEALHLAEQLPARVDEFLAAARRFHREKRGSAQGQR
jgi:CheY-like chemotaxis protein/HPt (histidine-containing phosphotransfer) domain-containing protein